MEKEIPMDPLVNENTWKIEGYQLKISFDFPDNIKDTLTLQQDNQWEKKESSGVTSNESNIPLSQDYVNSLYETPDWWEEDSNDRHNRFPN
jgi:hypothetical protein